jgi:PleD family two-component response regulator
MNVDLGARSISLAFSAGWTNYIPNESPEELLKRADDALYANKRLGKGQVELGVAIN